MWLCLLTALLLLCASPAQAQAQLQGGSVDLKGDSIDLVFVAKDLKFNITDMAGSAVNVAGKAQNLQVKETATEIRIEINADVLFDFDKATIKPEAASALHNVAEIINEKGKGRAVKIDGYTDSKGSDAYNQKLSERRADSVKAWLTQKEGLSQAKMTTQGFGAKQPVAPNTKPDGSDDPDGRQKNRRVEIVLAK
jgi:outer membrane protein OmpA-like peptidoglycan-associated protein